MKKQPRAILKILIGLAWILIGGYLILMNVPSDLMLQIEGHDVALADWYYEQPGQGAWTVALQEDGKVEIKRYTPVLAPVLPSNILSLSDEAVYDPTGEQWDVQKGWEDAVTADLDGTATLTAPVHGVDETGSILHSSIRFSVGEDGRKDPEALWSDTGVTPAGESFAVWVEILS